VLVAPRVPLQFAHRYATSANGIRVSQTAVQVSRGRTGRCWVFPHKIELCDGALFPKSCAKWVKRAARQPGAKAEANAWLHLARKRGRNSQGRPREPGGLSLKYQLRADGNKIWAKDGDSPRIEKRLFLPTGQKRTRSTESCESRHDARDFCSRLYRRVCGGIDFQINTGRLAVSQRNGLHHVQGRKAFRGTAIVNRGNLIKFSVRERKENSLDALGPRSRPGRTRWPLGKS
jgi:hypothetical protein